MNPEEQKPQVINDVTPSTQVSQISNPVVVTATPKPKSRLTLYLSLLLGLIILGFSGYLISNLPVKSQSTKAASSSTATTTKVKDTITIPDSIKPIDPKAVPLGGVSHVSTTTAAVGNIYSCSNVSGGGGASVDGPWLNAKAGTWDSTTKVSVSGSVVWSNATYSSTISGSNRIITGNDLPINGQTTGKYPIASSDKAYSYDRNPNSIAAQSINQSLSILPAATAKPNCLNMGAIGILNDGVVLFNGLDGENRDAAAYETLDSCDGHPERTSVYHHHDIPSCIMSKYTTASSSNLVGYANDGYGIYVERDAKGNLLTNANLDECHGRTSPINWDGKVTTMYHYVATVEFPYTLGCFHGTSVVSQSASSNNQGPPPRS